MSRCPSIGRPSSCSPERVVSAGHVPGSAGALPGAGLAPTAVSDNRLSSNLSAHDSFLGPRCWMVGAW